MVTAGTDEAPGHGAHGGGGEAHGNRSGGTGGESVGAFDGRQQAGGEEAGGTRGVRPELVEQDVGDEALSLVEVRGDRGLVDLAHVGSSHRFGPDGDPAGYGLGIRVRAQGEVGVDPCIQAVPGGVGGSEALLEALAESPGQVLHQGQEDLLLAAEVVVHEPASQPGRSGDGGDGRPVVPPLGHHDPEALDELGAALLAVARSGHGSLGSRLDSLLVG